MSDLRELERCACFPFRRRELTTLAPIRVQLESETLGTSKPLYMEMNEGLLLYFSDADKKSEDRRPKNGRVDYRQKYGTLMAARVKIVSQVEVVAELHVENPRTAAGQSAGNRPHFILFLHVNRSQG